MDLKATTGGKTVVRGRNGSQEFSALAVEDLGDLQSHVPGEDARFVTVFELWRWAQTAQGCDHVIHASMRRDDPNATIQQARSVGTLLERVQIARRIISESMVSGEEEPAEDDNAPKAQAPGTG